MRRLGLAGVALLAVACSGGGGSSGPATSSSVMAGTVLQVDDLSAAVGAVEAARGGPQRYVELNATPEGVNVFVAVDATDEVAYFFSNGALEAPGEAQPQTSAPFVLDRIDLALGPRLVDETQARFPGSTVVELALVQLPDQGIRWALRSRSARGGLLDVLYTTEGEVVSVAPAS